MTGETQPSFAAACGLAGPLVLGVQTTNGVGVSWRMFEHPFAVVGRHPGSDLHLEGADLSRRHAYFQVVGGRIFCVDLHSRTGTHWSVEPGPEDAVSPAAVVRVGAYAIRPRNGDWRTPLLGAGAGHNPGQPAARSVAGPSIPDLTLEATDGSSEPVTWRARRSLILLGKSSACQVRIVGPSIASIHASLVRTAAGVFVVDLLGPGGIRVNDAAVRWARLGEHDELTVGAQTFRVRGASTARPVAAPGVGVPPSLATPIQTLAPLIAGAFESARRPTADSFEAGVMNVLQSIVTLQQEQMTLLREELAAIRRLTIEQEGLQVELERRGGEAQAPRVLRVVAGESRALAPLAVPVQRVATGPGPGHYPLAIKAGPGRAANDGRAGGAAAGEDAFDAQVFDRLTAIQSERQNRWQRLRETMLGKES